MKKIILLLSLAFFSSTSFAAIECIGKVQAVLIYTDGTVNIKTSWRGDYVHICNLKNERQNVSITTCAMWASMLQNIKKNNGNASFYYYPDSRYDACSNVPVYAHAPAPVYIGDVL